MIAVDTNVLLRLIVEDDEVQTRKVVRLFEQLDGSDGRAFVSAIVLCEVVWVLRSAYGFGRAQIANAVEKLLAARQLVFESPDRLARALRSYQGGAR